MNAQSHFIDACFVASTTVLSVTAVRPVAGQDQPGPLRQVVSKWSRMAIAGGTLAIGIHGIRGGERATVNGVGTSTRGLCARVCTMRTDSFGRPSRWDLHSTTLMVERSSAG